MNIVDLHPEDLIDKLESGSLSSEEKRRLEAHLHGCVECRFEISVRSDLADEALAPRERPAGPLAPRTAPRPSTTRRTLPPRRALFIPAVAAALIAGGALAAVVSEVVRARTDEPTLHRLEAPRRAVVEATATGVAVRAESPAASLEPVAEPPPTSDAVRAVEERHVAAAAPAAAPAARGATAFASTRRTNKIPEPPIAEAEPRTAASLFGAANRARRYGDTAQAMALYHALQASFPASEEARLSRATLATLELDRGDPGAALDGFDRYIEQGGSALSVEALVGRAAALSKLGKASEELASWKEIARRFPGTVHAKRAAARIAVLSGR
jgi:TolA-binding protein